MWKRREEEGSGRGGEMTPPYSFFFLSFLTYYRIDVKKNSAMEHTHMMTITTKERNHARIYN
jgi:hypothetical protein